MTAKARILIVARYDERVALLAEGLDRLGWRTLTARGPYAAMAALADAAVEAAIVDLAGDEGDAAPMARRLKAACTPRRLPVVGLGDPHPKWRSHGFDLVVAPTLVATQAATRLEALVRQAISEEEFELRSETFAERGATLAPPVTDEGPMRVLAVGEPAPRFLSLTHALEEAGAEVVGAFTAYTAFDYLHERRFEAAVLWLGEDGKEGLQIAAGMRRNTRLYHVPTILCLETGARLDSEEAYAKGVTDIIAPGASAAEVADRVVELAWAYRRQSGVRNALEKARASGLMDAATGVFTRDLFAAHLRRLGRAAGERRRPLSLCVLRLADTPAVAAARAAGFLDRAIPQIGSMIGRLVRCEDTAARLSAEVFALAMPATGLVAARAAVDRIAAVIACTAFEAGRGAPPFTAAFEVGAAEVGSGENPVRALEIAAGRAARSEAV